MAPIPEKSQKLDDLHAEAMKRYNEAVDAEADQREECLDDIRFANVRGAQWDDWATKSRGDRPKLEINKVALPVNVYMGNFRQNDMSVTFRPSSGGATRKTAEVYKGLSRHILERSNWDSIGTNAATEQATGGIGAWRVMTQFSSDDTFEQEIRVGMIRSACTSVFYDPAAQKESKEDMNHCFVNEFVAKKAFEKKWPDAVVTGIPDPARGQGDSGAWRGDWFQPDRVRVAEYWVRTRIKQTLLLMSDGSTLIEEDAKDVLDELAAQDPPILEVNSREVMRHKVVRYMMTGSEFLEGPEDWPGQSIPIIPIFGYNTWIDGKHYFRGMVRFGKDPQRAYNYLSSQRIENEAFAPKDVVLMTKKQAKGQTTKISRMNVEHDPVYFYNHVEGEPPPFRLGNAAPQTELAAQLVQADQDIQATTGKFSPELGQNLGDQSGVALRALNQVGDQATFTLTENFMNGMFVMGGIFAELIPKFFTTAQSVRVLGDDAQEEFVEINTVVKDEQTGEEVMLHDITAGKYDQKVDIGPTFTTQRTEGLEILSSMVRDNPNLAPLVADLIATQMDFPFAPELERRTRRPLLAQGIIDPNEEEQEKLDAQKAEAQGQEQQGPSIQEQLEALTVDNVELSRELTRAKIETEKAKGDKTRAEVGKTVADTINVRTDTITESQEAGINPPITAEELKAELSNMGLLVDSIAEEGEQELPQGSVEQPPLQ